MHSVPWTRSGWSRRCGASRTVRCSPAPTSGSQPDTDCGRKGYHAPMSRPTYSHASPVVLRLVSRPQKCGSSKPCLFVCDRPMQPRGRCATRKRSRHLHQSTALLTIAVRRTIVSSMLRPENRSHPAGRLACPTASLCSLKGRGRALFGARGCHESLLLHTLPRLLGLDAPCSICRPRADGTLNACLATRF